MADKSKGTKAKGKDVEHVCDHEHWKHDVDDHDFPAAEEYLTLVMPDPDAKAYRKRFQELRFQLVHRKIKDIFRASQLPILPIDNRHVAHNIDRLQAGEKLSPLLLVRGNYQKPLIIADGYHRMCATYHVNEDMEVPCILL